MEMDNGEIVRNYRAAKNKNEQIRILADLNDCGTQEILDILTEAGEISGIRKKKVPRNKLTPEQRAEIVRLRDVEGMKFGEIAERLGLNTNTVQTSYRRAKYAAKTVTTDRGPAKGYMLPAPVTIPARSQEAKADKGKLRLSLVPTQVIRDIAEVREYGNRKYGDPNNWRLVTPDRYVDALYRHLLAFLDDWQSVDEESGIPHYKHIACNIAFLCEQLKEVDND